MFGEAEGGFGKSADCSVHFWLPQKGSGDIEGKCFPYCAPLCLVTLVGDDFFTSLLEMKLHISLGT